MATKKSKKTSEKAATDNGNLQQKLSQLAQQKILNEGWKSISISQLAKELSAPATAVFEICTGKRELLVLIAREATEAFLQTPIDDQTTAHLREIIFDQILCWLEAMDKLKPVVQAVADSSESWWDTAADLFPLANRAAVYIGDRTLSSHDGLQRVLLSSALKFIIADTLMIWIADGKDLSKTMAHLDRRLRTIEQWYETLTNALRRNDGGDED